ncbi:hypothetical protein EUX98_g2763 [Antrodiella citrinella]|uniref:Uncharacterized protein n=1 Tax=Antrodiella citrinella TaxID=2447956 RepID=A0A4S4N156_9APHY|nr:hypothetical protein EUX98_g2763 [Antrodiella citrinella]
MSRSPKKPHSSTKSLQVAAPSGLLTPPHSDQTPAIMLMSPPPEETLRTPRAKPTPTTSNAAGSTSSQGVTFRVGFTGRVISNTLAGKRKRSGISTSSSTSSLAEGTAIEDNHAESSKAAVEATPNPKPRKQTKRHVSFAAQSPSRETTPQPTTPTKSSHASGSPSKKSLMMSPHARNPAADYIPPIPSMSREHLSARRRSTTPVPPYEPPSERFTPPREVICSPIAATHTPKGKGKRKGAAKNIGKGKKLVLQIKKELPEDIDLSAPIPPPSPTEDPLLLRGPIGSARRRRRASSHPLQTLHYSRDTPPMAATSPIHGPDDDATRLMDLNFDSVMDMTSDDTTNMNIPDPFDFSAGNNAGDDWSDDEREANTFDQTGDFTGSFKVVAVPTKEDPPSDGTQERMNAWGRPKSPFPDRTVLEGADEDLAQREIAPAAARLRSPSPTVAGPSRVDDLFSPRRPVRSHTPPFSLRHSPSPAGRVQSPVSPLPPSDEEPPSPDEDPVSHGRFNFDTIEEGERSDDDDLYQDHIVLIHDTSNDSVVLEEDVQESADTAPWQPDEEPSDDADELARLASSIADVQPQSPPIPITRRSPTPVQRPPSSASPLAINHESSPDRESGYRSPPPTHDIHDSDDEEEEEVSVVRELSQPPDFDDEENQASEQFTSSFSKFSIYSSPNPFDPDGSVRRPRGSFVAERSKLYEETPVTSAAGYAVEYAVDEDDDDEELEDMDANVIKITSEDPRAAARAAAILRLHKYDNIEPSAKKRRHSTGLDSALRKARRKSTMEGGITKSQSSYKRRQSLGGMVGDKVIIPGSPMMTLPQLLHEAEQSLHIEDLSSMSGSPFRSISPLSYKTPARAPSLYESVLRSTVSQAPVTPASQTGPRAWSKSDWKALDSCYSDERLAAAEFAGMTGGEMVSADDVDLENVVDRFIELIGGKAGLTALGTAWTCDDLMKRVRALQRKQRSGHIAPPTPSRSGSVLSTDTASAPYQRFMSSMSPEASSHSSDATMTEGADLLAPLPQDVSYGELMDEAVSISSTPVAGTAKDYSYLTEPKRRSSIATRVKGFLFSYLPLMKTPAPPKVTTAQAGLPIPPPDLFLRPRPPISTPLPKPAPKLAHPKELVQLHPAPPPEKPSMIPRATDKNPRRFVELNHVSPPPEDKSLRSSTSSIRGRRDSNTSVKDMIKTFETLDQHADRSLELRREKSIQEWTAASTRNGPKKPIWR